MLRADVEPCERTFVRFQRSEGVGTEKCTVPVGIQHLDDNSSVQQVGTDTTQHDERVNAVKGWTATDIDEAQGNCCSGGGQIIGNSFCHEMRNLLHPKAHQEDVR